jgi:hypothetical protein
MEMVRSMGNDGNLVVGKGDDVLPADDNSDVSSGGGDDATTLVIGTIGTVAVSARATS